MPAPFYAVSQTLTLVASTEQHVSANHIYDNVVVDNSGWVSGANTGSDVYVAVDGGTATVKGVSCEMVPFGTTRVFSNSLPGPNAHVVGATAKWYNGFVNTGSGSGINGGPGTFDQSESFAWHAQLGWNGTNVTYCSVISAGTSIVTITFV